MPPSPSNATAVPYRIAFIGGGNMARGLISAQRRHGVPPASIRVAEPRGEARAELTRDFGVAAFPSIEEAVAGADCVVLAVKPQVIGVVGPELAGILGAGNPLILSIAAGIRIAQLERVLGRGRAIVRCMPNMPAQIGEGATGLVANGNVDPDRRGHAEAVLGAAGIVRWIDDEAQMDTVTALSGSGPAYFFLLAEAMEDAAVELGMPRDTARVLAAQTCLGAGHLLADGDESAATLRERITSPQGTTAAALEVLEQGGFRTLVQRALAAARERGDAMSRELDADA